MAGHEAAGRTIVYIDESGFAHDLPRTHGYAPKGERCHGVHDWQAKGRTNAIGALVGQALLTVALFVGTINADVFLAWLRQDLLPKLPADCVIVMDNASFHRRQDILEAISEAEQTLEFLPTYSPDLNPIEHKWAQIKSLIRKSRQPVEQVLENESKLFG